MSPKIYSWIIKQILQAIPFLFQLIVLSMGLVIIGSFSCTQYSVFIYCTCTVEPHLLQKKKIP